MAARPTSTFRASLGKAVHCVIPAAAGGGGSDRGFVRLDETTEPLLGGGGGDDKVTSTSTSTARSFSSAASRSSSTLPFSQAITTNHPALRHEADRAMPPFYVSEPTSIFCFRRGLSISTISSGEASAPRREALTPPPRKGPSHSGVVGGSRSASTQLARRPTHDKPPPAPVTGTKEWDLDASQPPKRLPRNFSPVGVNTVPALEQRIDSPTKSCMAFSHHRSLSARYTEERRVIHREGAGSIQTCPAAPSSTHPAKALESRRLAPQKPEPTTSQPPQQTQPRSPTGAAHGVNIARGNAPRRSRSTSRAPRRPVGSSETSGAIGSPNTVNRQQSPKRAMSDQENHVPAPESCRTRGQEEDFTKPRLTVKGSVVPAPDAKVVKSEPRLSASSRDVVTTRRKAGAALAASTATLDRRRTKRVHPQRQSRAGALQQDPALKPPGRVDGDVYAHNGVRLKRPLAPSKAKVLSVPKQVEFATAVRRGRTMQKPRSPRSVTSTETPTETTELSMTLNNSDHSWSNEITVEAPLPDPQTSWERFPAAPLSDRAGSHSRGPLPVTKRKASTTGLAPASSYAVVSDPFGNDEFMSWDPNDFDFDDDDLFGDKAN